MLSHQSRFTATNRRKTVLTILLVFLVVFNALGQVRTKLEASRFINPSPAAATYFRTAVRYGGGVVPYGSAEFISPTNAKLKANQLELVILDEPKLSNNRTDYDAIGIRWQGEVYQLSVPDDLIYPLMKFVQRGSYIAYTVAVAGFDEDYFKKNYLVYVGKVKLDGEDFNAYAARELRSAPHVKFLKALDLLTVTEPMNAKLTAMIMRDVGTGPLQLLQLAQSSSISSYVNADFHVTYKVFLVDNGKKVVDVGGLPLRYYWTVASDGSAMAIRGVEVFRFPRKEYSLQDRAVMFFQTAAILRQFNRDNKPAFNRFLREVGAAVAKK
jgi:hypothetical protein